MAEILQGPVGPNPPHTADATEKQQVQTPEQQLEQEKNQDLRQLIAFQKNVVNMANDLILNEVRYKGMKSAENNLGSVIATAFAIATAFNNEIEHDWQAKMDALNATYDAKLDELNGVTTMSVEPAEEPEPVANQS